jgi:hypothetical protein
MQTMHPTLLIGPSDWDAERMPRSEFVDRIEALFEHYPQAERAIVFGNSRHHAELAYFTNLIPKLGPALALLYRSGERRIFVGDAANMLGAARPLTFIENLASMKDAATAIAAEKAQRSVLIGADYMPMALRTTIVDELGKEASDATARVWQQMARKSGLEIDAVRRASALASVAGSAMLEAFETGASVSAVIVAGEEAAFADGAQDVRTLFSVDSGKTYRPFLAPMDRVVDPLDVYVAVRRFNYWAECFVLLSRASESDPLLEMVIGARAAALRQIRAGTPVSDIAAIIEGLVSPCEPHPLIQRAFAQRMGLALDERPHSDVGPTFEDGEVYSLRIGASDGKTCHCIASAMIRVLPGGYNVL